jgi:hypothetical protein
MSWFDDVFGGGGQSAANDMSNAYGQSIDDYQKYLDKSKETLDPWIQQGQQASQSNMGMGDEMMRQAMMMMGGGGYGAGNQRNGLLGPGGMQNPQMGQNGSQKPLLGPGGTYQGGGAPQATGMNLSSGGGQGGGTWMDNYQMSPMARYHMAQGMNAGENAAAASGMIGSNANQRGLMNMANDISSQDQQQYFNNMMGLMSGAQNSFNPAMQNGYNASNQLSNNYMNTGSEIGNAHQNQGMARAYGDQSRSSGIGNFLGSAGQALSSFF